MPGQLLGEQARLIFPELGLLFQRQMIQPCYLGGGGGGGGKKVEVMGGCGEGMD